MGIKQFNGEWVAREDRVILRLSTTEGEEFSFWLTRFMVRHLIQGSQLLAVKALEKEHPPEIAHVVQEFQMQNLTQKMDFGQAYEAPPQKPLGHDPILVVGLKMDQGTPHHAVEFELGAKKFVRFQMTPEMVQMMVALLHKLQETAQWHVGLDDVAPATLIQDAPNPTALLH